LLLLAIAVQGSAYQELLKIAARVRDQVEDHPEASGL